MSQQKTTKDRTAKIRTQAHTLPQTGNTLMSTEKGLVHCITFHPMEYNAAYETRSAPADKDVYDISRYLKKKKANQYYMYYL